jgi:hypothetical protein
MKQGIQNHLPSLNSLLQNQRKTLEADPKAKLGLFASLPAASTKGLFYEYDALFPPVTWLRIWMRAGE